MCSVIQDRSSPFAVGVAILGNTFSVLGANHVVGVWFAEMFSKILYQYVDWIKFEIKICHFMVL